VCTKGVYQTCFCLFTGQSVGYQSTFGWGPAELLVPIWSKYSCCLKHSNTQHDQGPVIPSTQCSQEQAVQFKQANSQTVSVTPYFVLLMIAANLFGSQFYDKTQLKAQAGTADCNGWNGTYAQHQSNDIFE